MTDFIHKTPARYELLKKKYGTERVYSVPYSSALIVPDGFTPWNPRTSSKNIYGMVLPYGKFLLRADAEENITFQQIIPYVLVQTESGKSFVTRRKQGEQRLQGRLSLGVGGHINPCDDRRKGVENMVKTGLQRELKEEVVLPEIHKIYEYGTVRDLKSSTPDHIGIVFIAEIADKDAKEVTVKETENLEGLWMKQEELVSNLVRFESWAQMIIAHKELSK